MREYLTRKARRLSFYLRGAIHDRLPGRWLHARRERCLDALRDEDLLVSVRPRVNYYNKLDLAFTLPAASPRADTLTRDVGSYYYYDLQRYLKCFPPELRLNWLLGDNIIIPDQPAIVKSRPIAGDNHNAVVMKLDQLRHYRLFSYRDRLSFSAKEARACWRGILNNPLRQSLVSRYGRDSRHDIGYVDPPRLDIDLPPSQPLNIADQFKCRYVLSVEGYDVATNLKWIFASNSLCLMPRPRYETWFMEGALRDGVEYVELRDDFADLDEKIDWFEAHPQEAEAIIRNANRHYRQFLDQPREDLVSLLVLEKYFERSGQLPARSFSADLFG